MRVKKQKRHRRTVKFFVAVFGFRDPFKILCDGTFIHHLRRNDIVPADKALSSILGGPVKLFTTRCVIAELKRIGSSYSESLDVAHQLICAKCNHEKTTSAETCIMDVVGESNDGHFFVATQDADLRKGLREVPGVPLIFALRNALLLEPPSEKQHEFAKNSESRRLHMTKVEQTMLTKRVKNMEEDLEFPEREEDASCPGTHSVLAQALTQSRAVSKVMHGKEGPQFKRNRAKGPNPLSVKKKKKSGNDQLRGSLMENGADKDTARKRKRKRSHKVKSPAENE